MIQLGNYLAVERAGGSLVEVVNGLRTAAYCQNCGELSTPTSDGSCAGDGYDDTFTTPTLDPAPWYDADVAESAGFYGASADPSKITVASTFSRTTGQRIGAGSVLGRGRQAGLQIVFDNVWLIGESCESVDYGTRWFVAQLRALDCGEAVIYVCPGEAQDRRTLCRVGLVSVEDVTPEGIDRCVMRVVRFTLASELPWWLSDAETCVDGETFTTPDALTNSSGYGGAVAALLPAAYWRFSDTGAPTVMDDESPNARDGAWVNTPTHATTSLIASDAGDSSVTLDGSTEYGTVPDNAIWDQTQDFTFVGWFNSTGGHSGRRRLVERLAAGGASSLWKVTYDVTNSRLDATVTFPAGSVTVAGGTVGENETHMFALVRSRAAPGTVGVPLTETVTLYLDGVAVGSSTIVSTPIASSDQGLTFGRSPLGFFYYFGGRLDDYAFITDPLTATQIVALYAAAVQGAYAPIDPLCCLVENTHNADDEAVTVTVEGGNADTTVRVTVVERDDKVCPVGFVDTGTDGAVTFSAASSFVLPALTDASEDDVQLAWVQVAHETTVVTAPAGWHLILDDSDSTGATNRLLSYWRRMGTTDTAGSRTFTLSIAASGQGYVSNYPGSDADVPVVAFNSGENAAGTAHVAPTITTDGPTKIVMAVALVANSSFSTPPQDMVERHDAAEGAARTMGVWDEWSAAAEVVGTKTATSAGAGTSVAGMVALRASAATYESDFTVTVPAGQTVEIDAGCRQVTHATDDGTYEAMILSDGPVAYWRLGEASGTTAEDRTGDHDGTYVNTPTLGVAGLIDDADTAVSFDPASSEYVLLAAGIFNPNAAFTIEAWIDPDVDGTDDVIYGSQTGASAYWFFINRSDVGLCWQYDIGAGAVNVGDSVGGRYVKAGDGGAHVVVTRSGNVWTIYINGVAVGTETNAVATLQTTGVDRIGNWGAAGNFYDGTIDEVAVYNVALTAAQILEHYRRGLAAAEAAESNGLGQVAASGGALVWPEVPAGESRCVCITQVGAHDASVQVSISSRSRGTV